jgi:hypothetical protein
VYFPEVPGLSADFVSLDVVITDGATFSIFCKASMSKKTLESNKT